VAAEFRWDDFRLDLGNFRLERNGVPLPLEPKALNLLAFLLAHAGRLVTKQEIFDAVWPQTAVTDHALTRVVAQLRRTLGDEAREARYIETVPTRGYRWVRPLIAPEAESRTPPPDQHTEAAPSPDGATASVPPMATVVSHAGSTTAVDRPGRAFAFRGVASALVAVVVLLLAYSQRSAMTPAASAGTDGGPVRATGGFADMKWPVQLTTRNGLDLHPAISPQGDALAFANDRTGSFEICVRASSGPATDTPLTSDGAQNVQPAWSPDGRFIAYHSYSRGGIWVIPARGGVPRQLAARGSHPAWSPDGSSIAFQSDEHADVTPSAWLAVSGSTLWRVDVATSALTQMTFMGKPAGGHAAPAWSADGRFLAFTVFEAGDDGGVWLLDVRTGDTRPLTDMTGLYELSFAPDNRAIYATGGEARITRLPFDARTGTLAGPPVVLPIGGVPGVRGLSISADGKTLVFGGIALSSHIWTQSIGSDGTPAGSARAVTSDTSRRNSLAKMSPDGSRIVYLSTRRGAAPDLWVMDADGANAVPLTVNGFSGPRAAWLRWLPDSKHVQYLSGRNGTVGLWTIDIVTRREELQRAYGSAVDALRRLGEMEVSPGGTQLALALLTPPDGRKRLYLSPLDTITPQPLTDTGADSVGYPAWAPDERRIAAQLKADGSTQAAVFDLTTGAVRRLTNTRGHTWIRSWSPDGRQLAAAVLRDGRWSLSAFDASSGEERVIIPPLPPHVYVRYPEWSPRGDTIVFERGELHGNIWSLPLR
jgi:Tol biopolymer transport system component/DNA-binding winged helix-turn-helix (wHTH) protein